ncbi:MAG TPA: hypothetical protein GXX19_10840 [Syntrophomonadaceae bacterium]|nr:hypothetical protein [Syntrophomonadaceae bacterium]
MDRLLLDKIYKFTLSNDFTALYKAYNWRNDNWQSGFRDIFAIEKLFMQELSELYISSYAVMQIVYWGNLRNPARVKCPNIIYITNTELFNPESMYNKLCKETDGLGPTYISKIIRFANPRIAGAIDSRIVRVFGKGYSSFTKCNWLDLKAVKHRSGWYINKNQKGWPEEYFLWLDILTKIRNLLNKNGIQCPHPNAFVTSGLREKGKWTCADVEMALFAYSTRIVRSR